MEVRVTSQQDYHFTTTTVYIGKEKFTKMQNQYQTQDGWDWSIIGHTVPFAKAEYSISHGRQISRVLTQLFLWNIEFIVTNEYLNNI